MPPFKCILLVDDDPIANYISSALIKHLHFSQELLTASSGQEALAIILGHSNQESCFPDLVLLDINMPVYSGFNLLEDLNKHNLQERPIIYLLTSSQNPKDKIRAAELKADGFLAKPLSEDTLLKLVAEVQKSVRERTTNR